MTSIVLHGRAWVPLIAAAAESSGVVGMERAQPAALRFDVSPALNIRLSTARGRQEPMRYFGTNPDLVVHATDEQLNDSVALEGWINKYLPLELTFRTEDAVVNGVAAPPGNSSRSATYASSAASAAMVGSTIIQSSWSNGLTV